MDMQFGVCGDPRLAAVAARAGFDFAESSVESLLAPRAPEASFRAALAEMRGTGLPCPALNRLLPAELKVTGPAVDAAALDRYLDTALQRAEAAGVSILVFGSAGARQVPPGWDRAAAHGQLVDFCARLGPRAADHGVTIVVEPLNRVECNVLTTVAESAALVREVAHPAVRLLVDAYHFLRDQDSCADLAAHGDLLRHAHIATIPHRLAPGAEPCDFAPFFAALARGGYRGRLSVEGNLRAPETELPAALARLRDLAAAAASPEAPR
jgi:sugar phosphate isomerase/epimerase